LQKKENILFTDFIGYLAGTLLTICFLPQIFKTIKIKKADEVSMVMLILSFCSALLYEIYAFLLGLWPVLVMNGIFALLIVVEIFLKIYYDRQARV